MNLNSMYQIGVAKEFYNHILTDNEKNNYTENYITYYDNLISIRKIGDIYVDYTGNASGD